MSIRSMRPSTVQTDPPPRARVADASLADAPWRALCPRGVLELRDPEVRPLQDLPSGTPVALLSDRPLSRRRLRRTAHLAGIRIEREIIVVPSTTAALVALDDTESAVRHFWSAVAAVPPGLARTSAAATAMLAVAGLLPWRCTGAVAPGRVLIGSRR